MKNSELLSALIHEIEEHGVTSHEVKRGTGKHPKLIFEFGGPHNHRTVLGYAFGSARH